VQAWIIYQLDNWKELFYYLVVVFINLVNELCLSDFNIFHESEEKVDFIVKIFLIDFVVSQAKVPQKLKTVDKHFGDVAGVIELSYFFDNMDIIF